MRVVGPGVRRRIVNTQPRHRPATAADRSCPRPWVGVRFAWTAALARCVAIAVLVLMLSSCIGNEHMSFLDPQGPVAHAEAVHFYWIVGIMAVFVAGPIFLALPFFLWRYRYGNTRARYTPNWKDSAPVIAFTWIGPVLIVCGLGYFVWTDSHRLNPYRALASDQPPLQMQVIGYDWKWLFIYPKQGIATIGTMALPVGRPVTLHVTSATVMQSFFIPALGSQIYAMGGMVTRLNLEATHPGRYLGENTMYNGNGFHFQKFTAVGMTPDDFKAWVSQVKFNGTPIDAHILRTIGQCSTREQMLAAMPSLASGDGAIYLKDVSPRLFPAIVKAVKRGTAPGLAHAMQGGSGTRRSTTCRTPPPRLVRAAP